MVSVAERFNKINENVKEICRIIEDCILLLTDVKKLRKFIDVDTISAISKVREFERECDLEKSVHYNMGKIIGRFETLLKIIHRIKED